MTDHETFVNIQMHPRSYYDNPPSPTTKESDEQFPILANHSTELYTSTNQTPEINESSTNEEGDDNEDRLDVPYSMPRYPLSRLFSVTVYLLEILGIACIALVIIWLWHYHGGFGWDGETKEFNWHPLFMVIGLVFFYGNAAISSYVLRAKITSRLHYFHGISIVMTLLFTVIGFVTGLQVERQFFTFHTWLGVMTLSVLFLQSLVGFTGLFISCKDSTRKRFLQYQIGIFLCVFLCSIMTCILGIAGYLQTYSSSYRTDLFTCEGLVTNFICLLLVVFGILVSSLLTHPIYTQL